MFENYRQYIHAMKYRMDQNPDCVWTQQFEAPKADVAITGQIRSIIFVSDDTDDLEY